MRRQSGVDALNDLQITGTAIGPEAAVKLGLRHESGKSPKIRQQSGVAAGAASRCCTCAGRFAGGASPSRTPARLAARSVKLKPSPCWRPLPP